MIIMASTLAKAINQCRYITQEELQQDNIITDSLKHWKVYFDIEGKTDPFTWYCFAKDYTQAKAMASKFLTEELSKGFYKTGFILSIKQV